MKTKISGKVYETSNVTIFYQVPQFLLIGTSEVFTVISGDLPLNLLSRLIKVIPNMLFRLLSKLDRELRTSNNLASIKK